MKKIVIVFLFPIFALAQDVYQKTAEHVCGCLETKKLDLKSISKDKLTMELAQCMMGYVSEFDEATRKEVGIESFDGPSMRKFGEKVGMKMVSVCPEILFVLGGRDGESDEIVEEVKPIETVKGQLTEIKKGQFLTLVVADGQSRTQSFLVLGNFNGSAFITGNGLKKRDKIEISYEELEIFDPAIGEFRKFKVIVGLKKLN